MGAFSTVDRPMMSTGTQKGGASSSTRLQPQITSSFLGLTPGLVTASDMRGMFANVMTGLEELRQDMMKRINQVGEGAQHAHERLRDELADAKSPAKNN